jgi:hypothetical protein
MRRLRPALVNQDIGKLEQIVQKLRAICKKYDFVETADINVIANDINDYIIEPLALSVVADSDSQPLILKKRG